VRAVVRNLSQVTGRSIPVQLEAPQNSHHITLTGVLLLSDPTATQLTIPTFPIPAGA
jgi:hypothetical protein